MEIVTSWMETGIERGMAQGISQGIIEGISQGERELFLRLARRRLGEPDESALVAVQNASKETIEAWADLLFTVETWPELLSKQ